VPDPPVITLQPVGISTNAGATVQFNVAASGAGPIAYQWRQNQTNNLGTNGPALTLTSLTRSNGGLYSVRVSNSGGAVDSSNALLKVLIPQRFALTPLLNGNILFFSVDADGGLLSSNDLAGFTAQSSSNLVDWLTLPNALSVTNGMLMLRDTNQANYRVRFYRVFEQ
jgi:hypothetical protein